MQIRNFNALVAIWNLYIEFKWILFIVKFSASLPWSFLACAASECDFCFIENKRAWSYVKRHTISEKQKIITSNKDNDPSIKESLSNNCRFDCPLCNFRFDNSTSWLGKKRIEMKCINCNEMLLSCYICAYLTSATSHAEKSWEVIDVLSGNNYSLGKKIMNHKNEMMESLAYHHQHKINKLEKMLPTIQSNLMHQSQKLITMQFSEDRKTEKLCFNLKIFIIFHINMIKTINENTQIFDPKSSKWVFFWQNHLMWKEGKLLGGLCRLLYRSVYQDFESFHLMPISGKILILQLLDYLVDVTKKDRRDWWVWFLRFSKHLLNHTWWIRMYNFIFLIQWQRQMLCW